MAANVLVEQAMTAFNRLPAVYKQRIKTLLKCKSTDSAGLVRTHMSELSDWNLVHVVMDEIEVLEESYKEELLAENDQRYDMIT